MFVTSSPDLDPGRDSRPGTQDGARAFLPACELAAIRGRVAEWDAQFDDLALPRVDGADLTEGVQTDRTIASWIVRLAFPRLAFYRGWRLATRRRVYGDRCLAWTVPMAPDGGLMDGVMHDLFRAHEDGPFSPDRILDPTLFGTMATLEGDGSLEAYIEAAVLYRELAELGSRGRSDPWRAHRIVDVDPFMRAGPEEGRADAPRPRSAGLWTPEARRGRAGGVAVRFWTVPIDGELRVLEHHYRFTPGTMRVDLDWGHITQLGR
jgi:hypothetical protein